MSFWEQNKLFAIIAGAVALACIVLRPSCIGEWLAPWRGPVVIYPHHRNYKDVQRKTRSLDPKMKRYFPTKGKNVTVGAAAAKAAEGNKVLLGNYGDMHRWMSFIPRFPFRIPARRVDNNERQRYVSLVYTYAREGELICREFEIRDPADGVAWLAATRNIHLGDPYFGMRNMELPENIEDPDTRILQVALVHELGHLAIRAGVDEITAIAPEEPYAWGIDDVEVATAYPVTARVKCDLPTLLRFIHALDGAHGRVAEVHDLAVAAEAAAPLPPAKPKPPAPADDDPDDNAPAAEPPAPAPPDPKAVRIVVELDGQPSVFRPNRARGDLKERLTVFRPHASDPHKLTFVGNAVVHGRRPDGKLEAHLEPTSDITFGPDGTPLHNPVRRGDLVATRFFLVRSMSVKAVEAEIQKDQDGFPTNVTPAHLEAEFSVAALRFAKLELPEAKAPRKTKKKAPTRAYKKPTKRF